MSHPRNKYKRYRPPSLDADMSKRYQTGDNAWTDFNGNAIMWVCSRTGSTVKYRYKGREKAYIGPMPGYRRYEITGSSWLLI